MYSSLNSIVMQRARCNTMDQKLLYSVHYILDFNILIYNIVVITTIIVLYTSFDHKIFDSCIHAQCFYSNDCLIYFSQCVTLFFSFFYFIFVQLVQPSTKFVCVFFSVFSTITLIDMPLVHTLVISFFSHFPSWFFSYFFLFHFFCMYFSINFFFSQENKCIYKMTK